jgi:hypothetical protein
MMLDDLLAARMLCRHVHIALTRHLLAALFLRSAHPRVGHQTVHPRYSKEQQEHGCSDDLVEQLHSG